MNKFFTKLIFVLLISQIFSGNNDDKLIIPLKIDTSIQIDGFLNEDVWNSIESIDDFIQIEPNFNTSPTKITEVKVFYNDDFFYFGSHILCH